MFLQVFWNGVPEQFDLSIYQQINMLFICVLLLFLSVSKIKTQSDWNIHLHVFTLNSIWGLVFLFSIIGNLYVTYDILKPNDNDDDHTMRAVISAIATFLINVIIVIIIRKILKNC